MASALAYGFGIAFAVFVAMFIWVAAGSLLFPADHARAHAVGADIPPVARIRTDTYCMGERRRVPCRGKTHRRYGRRRDSKGYLETQQKRQQKTYDKQRSEHEGGLRMGLASVRGGDDTSEVCIFSSFVACLTDLLVVFLWYHNYA